MDKKSRASIKKKIVQSIHKIKEDIVELEELTKPIGPENAIGRISRMDAINNRSINEAALRTSRTKLENLKKALAKSDDDDFGICTRCHRPIPEGRLLLMPESIRCVNCA